MVWDTKQWRERRDKQLLRWFRGDLEAVKCFVMISQVAETWDDIVDGDPVKIKDVNNSFMFATFGLAHNSFYRKHQDGIAAMEVVIANAWLDANELVLKENKDAKIRAYVLRNLGLELVPLFAFYKGGYAYMRAVSEEIRDFFTHETFDEWQQELQ